jgi:hypothetical protein
MALLSPSLPIIPPSNGLQRELDVLERLQLSLSDGYQIFHSVSWHSLHKGSDRHGEIDIVVLAPNGNILLIEVKSGHVQVADGVMVKLYKDGPRDVGRQYTVQHAAMMQRLNQAGLRAQVTNCVVLPDHRLGVQHVIAIPPERIIDATRFDQLGSLAREMLEGMTRFGVGEPNSSVESLRQFFANEFKVTPDMSVLGDQVRQTTLRLADGLATWVPRIVAPSGVIRVQATAGSGKTQLALRLLQDAASKGVRALYVCFNRALADHIGHIAPARAKVASFHELCVEHYRQTVGEPDFAAPDNFQRLGRLYCEAVESADSPLVSRYGLVIIDEGQDFDPEWVGSLIPQLLPEGRLYLLEDDSQRLYAREGFDLAEAVEVNCQDNFRSPKAVCEVINALGLTALSVEARGPYEGNYPGFHAYDTERECVRLTEVAVGVLLARGIALADIAVISFRGLGKSVLAQADTLGRYSVRRFTGKYAPSGEALWTEGELLVDSVYRFKWQSAAGVVLTEVDFSELDEAAKRKLFVGMTRAQLGLEVVMSRAAEGALAAVL